MANEFSTGKSIFVLAIVAGCFAILWPNVFYPMLQGSYSPKDSLSSAQGCCDVIFDSDVNAIKVMIEICEKILSRQVDFDSRLIFTFQQGKLTKDIVEQCQKTVYDYCNIDIAEFLMEKVRLGRSYKQMLDEIRSLNSSLCLKQSFGVSLGEIGLPRRIRTWGLNKPKHMRQERPPHLRPEFLHPALREKGRAIPHSHVVPKVNVQEGKAPLPGMRPPMGGPGQVVPPPKGSGTMGIIMPMYTIGIIVFFLYTMMKLLFKKSDSEPFETFTPDPQFRKTVLKDSGYSGVQDIAEDGSKLGDTELDFLRKRLQETEKAMERIVAKMMSLPNYSHPPEENEMAKEIQSEKSAPIKEKIDFEDSNTCNLNTVGGISSVDEDPTDIESKDGKNVVKVLGMEMTESCEHGAKWSRPPTPLSRPPTPQNIFISGSLPSKSQLLVSDSHTETAPDEENAVVLTGKVTLSLIGLSENGNNATDKGYGDLSYDASLKSSEENGKIIKSSLNESCFEDNKPKKEIIDSDDEEFVTVNNKDNEQ